MICPKCKNIGLGFVTEKRPEGNSVCNNCEYKGATSEFFPHDGHDPYRGDIPPASDEMLASKFSEWYENLLKPSNSTGKWLLAADVIALKGVAAQLYVDGYRQCEKDNSINKTIGGLSDDTR